MLTICQYGQLCSTSCTIITTQWDVETRMPDRWCSNIILERQHSFRNVEKSQKQQSSRSRATLPSSAKDRGGEREEVHTPRSIALGTPTCVRWYAYIRVVSKTLRPRTGIYCTLSCVMAYLFQKIDAFGVGHICPKITVRNNWCYIVVTIFRYTYVQRERCVTRVA